MGLLGFGKSGGRSQESELEPGKTVTAGCIPDVPLLAAGAKATYKVGDIVAIISPDEVEGKEYADFYKRNEGGARITAVSDEGYTVNDEMLLQDDYILRKLAALKQKKEKKTAEPEKPVNPPKGKDEKKPKAGIGRRPDSPITLADIRAKVDFAKYTTIPTLLKAIVNAGIKQSQIYRLLGLASNGDIMAAINNGRVYPYMERAVRQHLQFPPPVPATERELAGLDSRTLAKPREPGF